MAQELPKGFMSLGEASQVSNANHNIMGVVTDILPPIKSRGTDWTVTFTIADLLTFSRVRMFASSLAALPLFSGTGDVIILRNVRQKPFNGSSLFQSGKDFTSWAIIHSASIPESMVDQPTFEYKASTTPSAAKPSVEEFKHAWHLCNLQDRSSFKPMSIVTADLPSLSVGSVRDKFSLIKDMGTERNYDIVGEVIKTYPSMNCVDVYVTDYTSNGLLYDHGGKGDDSLGQPGDEHAYISRTDRKWEGPIGQMALCVSLFPPHMAACLQNVKEGDYVELSNIYTRLRTDSAAQLQARIHPDKQYQDKINVRKVYGENDDRVKDMLKRKWDYLTEHGDFRKKEKQETNSKKRKAEQLAGPQQLSRNQKKRKGQKNKQKKGQHPVVQDKENVKPGFGTDPAMESRRAKRKAIETPNQEILVRCPGEVGTRPLSAILNAPNNAPYLTPGGKKCTLPFQNICSKANVRVVDFFPHSLADFCVRQRKSEFDILDDDHVDDRNDNDDDWDPSDSSSDSSQDSDNPQPIASMTTGARKRDRSYKWEWRFALLIEDVHSYKQRKDNIEPERMILYVAGDDGEFLTKMDPCNLRGKEQQLNRLREKMFIVWGDLEEVKAKRRAAQEKINERKTLLEKDGNANGVSTQVNDGNDSERGSPNLPSQRPFTCCIKEFGSKVSRPGEPPRWERRFRMLNTTIK